jgi:hypothetical protein
MSRTWYTAFVILLATSLAACSVRAPTRALAPLVVITRVVEVEQVVCVAVTCETSFDAFSWIDANENGMVDDGESPFPGVKFTAYRGSEELSKPSYPLHTPTVSPHWLSNQEGVTHFYLNHTGEAPDCKDACDTSRKAILGTIVVKARVPLGYRLTTPRRQSIEDGLNFGFVRVVRLKQR